MGIFRRKSGVDRLIHQLVDDKKTRKAVIKRKNEYSDLASQYSEVASDKALEYYDLALARLQADPELRKIALYAAAGLIAVGIMIAVKKRKNDDEGGVYVPA